MTIAVDDAITATRDRLIAALFDQLRGALDLARIAAVVDTALAGVALAALLETVVAADAAVTALAGEVTTPPPAVQGQVDVWDARYAETQVFFF